MSEEKCDPVQETRRVYADIFGSVFMVAMFCATFITTTHMWIEERRAEMLVQSQMLRVPS